MIKIDLLVIQYIWKAIANFQYINLGQALQKKIAAMLA